MTADGENTRINLSDLVAEKLSKQIVNAIEDVEVREQSPFALRSIVQDGYLIVDLHTRIQVKKVLAYLGGLVSFLLAVVNVILPYLQAVLNRFGAGG